MLLLAPLLAPLLALGVARVVQEAQVKTPSAAKFQSENVLPGLTDFLSSSSSSSAFARQPLKGPAEFSNTRFHPTTVD